MSKRGIVFSVVGLAVAWQIVAMLVNRDILPAPWDVFVVFVDELDNGLVTHFFYSLWRVTAGMALSVLAAAPAGLLNLLPHYLFVVSNSKSGLRACSFVVFGNRRRCKNYAHFPNLIFSDRGAGT